MSAPKSNEEPVMRTVHRRRIAGVSWPEIAEELYGNLSVLYPLDELRREYNEYLSVQREHTSRENLVQQELDRLDELHRIAWERAVSDPDEGQLKAIREVANISKLRSKLLGLDLPDPKDAAVQAQVIMVGNDHRAFVEALAAGRLAGTVGNGADKKGIES